jgi:hypothetical protein
MREVSLGWCLENEVQRKDDSKLHVLYIKGKSLFVMHYFKKEREGTISFCS